ncbi:MAG: hypothetical protein C4576_35405 [Desulfobacteraceae bacterium]|nr:MAG: hypothetical protein C4576_35405 [Desulfobacteraceae bacterium]
MSESFLDRLQRQAGWSLAALNNRQLVICGDAGGMVRTLALAAVCSGWRRVAFASAGKARGFLGAVAEEVMGHLGGSCRYLPIYSPEFVRIINRWEQVWIVDAGDRENDGVTPKDGHGFYYAECRTPEGDEFIALGTDRDQVTRWRKGSPVADRAEVPAVCAMLLIGALASAEVCLQLAPIPAFCRIGLPPIPSRWHSPQVATLYAGGGGAIAQQEIWAEYLDPVLRRINQEGQILVVDPKIVHESCRSRQWAYGPETLFLPKADLTAGWLRALFPGVVARSFTEPLAENHFRSVDITEALSSIDTWSGRKVLANLCSNYNIDWWSAGASFWGGFARRVSGASDLCASADEGVERLSTRPDDEVDGRSCTGQSTPEPSSVLPHMILGSWIACQRRSVFLGQSHSRTLAQGIEAHLTHGGLMPGYEGLRWSPGRLVNLRTVAFQKGGGGCARAGSAC